MSPCPRGDHAEKLCAQQRERAKERTVASDQNIVTLLMLSSLTDSRDKHSILMKKLKN
jgi:hypothetical protein